MTKLSEEIPLLSMKTVKEKKRLQITAKVKNLCGSNDPRKTRKITLRNMTVIMRSRSRGIFHLLFLVWKHHELNARMGVSCVRLVALDVWGIEARKARSKRQRYLSYRMILVSKDEQNISHKGRKQFLFVWSRKTRPKIAGENEK